MTPARRRSTASRSPVAARARARADAEAGWASGSGAPPIRSSRAAARSLWPSCRRARATPSRASLWPMAATSRPSTSMPSREAMAALGLTEGDVGEDGHDQTGEADGLIGLGAEVPGPLHGGRRPRRCGPMASSTRATVPVAWTWPPRSSARIIAARPPRRDRGPRRPGPTRAGPRRSSMRSIPSAHLSPRCPVSGSRRSASASASAKSPRWNLTQASRPWAQPRPPVSPMAVNTATEASRWDSATSAWPDS